MGQSFAPPLKKTIRKTPLQMLLRVRTWLGYRHYSDDIVVRIRRDMQLNPILGAHIQDIHGS